VTHDYLCGSDVAPAVCDRTMLTQHFVPKVTLLPLMIQDTCEKTTLPLNSSFFPAFFSPILLSLSFLLFHHHHHHQHQITSITTTTPPSNSSIDTTHIVHSLSAALRRLRHRFRLILLLSLPFFFFFFLLSPPTHSFFFNFLSAFAFSATLFFSLSLPQIQITTVISSDNPHSETVESTVERE